ncbi:MAG: transcription antitermination factor NusB [Acidimicrobiaceae bacterium]|nr:transcription antitermination factor NusB [Acidimicrobiaceae bacterium]|tara:strand:- start:108 stop:566 length:459 start_codon:yes stop_codon:yes gene_type:complete
MNSSASNELSVDTPEYIAKRREGRETILGLLYESELKQIDFHTIVDSLPIPLDGYASSIKDRLTTNLETIDTEVADISKGWELQRMPTVDLSILRVAMCEIITNPKIPAVVVVSEAVELAAKYSTDASGPFINGVLAEACRRFRPDEPVDQN